MAIDNLTQDVLQRRPTEPWNIASAKFAAYFWSRLSVTADDTRCWEWQYSKNPQGYGTIKIAGRTYRSHRVAWQLANGRTPTLDILHSCDNPSCCNPKHLREGTDKENQQDARDRQRWTPNYGEANGKAFFTATEIYQIKQWIAEGKTTREMTVLEPRLDKYMVYRLRHNRTWKHVHI